MDDCDSCSKPLIMLTAVELVVFGVSEARKERHDIVGCPDCCWFIADGVKAVGSGKTMFTFSILHHYASLSHKTRQTFDGFTSAQNEHYEEESQQYRIPHREEFARAYYVFCR